MIPRTLSEPIAGLKGKAHTATRMNSSYHHSSRVDFLDAVRNAILTGVPCARSYSVIKLLQIIDTGEVQRQGMIVNKHVLTNPENNKATLSEYIDDTNLKNELEKL
jgi:hypothetical protein